MPSFLGNLFASSMLGSDLGDRSTTLREVMSLVCVATRCKSSLSHLHEEVTIQSRPWMEIRLSRSVSLIHNNIPLVCDCHLLMRANYGYIFATALKRYSQPPPARSSGSTSTS